MKRNKGKKQRNNWIPAEEIGNNIDLLTEILLRLQVKPLVTFKCVSKQWLSLISDPQFCLSHTRHHHSPYPTTTAILLNKGYAATPQFKVFGVKKNYPTPEFGIVPLKQATIPTVRFDCYPNLFRISQSCNGLLLCSCQQFGMTYRLICSYFICNLATKKFKSLCFPSLKFQISLVAVCMAFDPLKSNHYKLISICIVEDVEKYRIDMYSSETDSWSLLGITFTAKFIHFYNPVFCNGAVHWYSEGKTSLYFDVERECLNTMPMPNLDNRGVQYFGESQGHLHIIVTEWPYPLQFDVLEMAADYSGWFVRYHVNLDAVRTKISEETRFSFLLLHVIRAQREEDSIVVLYVGDKAISYNVHDGTLKKLCDFDTPVNYDYARHNTFQCFEILTSV